VSQPKCTGLILLWACVPAGPGARVTPEWICISARCGGTHQLRTNPNTIPVPLCGGGAAELPCRASRRRYPTICVRDRVLQFCSLVEIKWLSSIMYLWSEMATLHDILDGSFMNGDAGCRESFVSPFKVRLTLFWSSVWLKCRQQTTPSFILV
jgi:hypothetical protein